MISKAPECLRQHSLRGGKAETQVSFTRGAERLIDALAGAAISGLIVPDLPIEESDELREICDGRGIARYGNFLWRLAVFAGRGCGG